MGIESEIEMGFGAFMLLYVPWRIWHDHQPWKEALGTFGVLGLAVMLGTYTAIAPNQLLILVDAVLLFIAIRNISKYRDRTKVERAARVEKIRRSILHR
jgi:hypothetical protein